MNRIIKANENNHHIPTRSIFFIWTYFIFNIRTWRYLLAALLLYSLLPNTFRPSSSTICVVLLWLKISLLLWFRVLSLWLFGDLWYLADCPSRGFRLSNEESLLKPPSLRAGLSCCCVWCPKPFRERQCRRQRCFSGDFFGVWKWPCVR